MWSFVTFIKSSFIFLFLPLISSPLVLYHTSSCCLSALKCPYLIWYVFNVAILVTLSTKLLNYKRIVVCKFLCSSYDNVCQIRIDCHFSFCFSFLCCRFTPETLIREDDVCFFFFFPFFLSLIVMICFLINIWVLQYFIG